MFVVHQFYENSQSWANSRVECFNVLEEAQECMCDTILDNYKSVSNISWMEKEDALEVVKILRERTHETIEETVWEFTVQCDDMWYYLVDNYGEDQYHCQIIDTNLETISQF
jgi:hypothetical protein